MRNSISLAIDGCLLMYVFVVDAKLLTKDIKAMDKYCMELSPLEPDYNKPLKDLILTCKVLNKIYKTGTKLIQKDKKELSHINRILKKIKSKEDKIDIIITSVPPKNSTKAGSLKHNNKTVGNSAVQIRGSNYNHTHNIEHIAGSGRLLDRKHVLSKNMNETRGARSGVTENDHHNRLVDVVMAGNANKTKKGASKNLANRNSFNIRGHTHSANKISASNVLIEQEQNKNMNGKKTSAHIISINTPSNVMKKMKNHIAHRKNHMSTQDKKKSLKGNEKFIVRKKKTSAMRNKNRKGHKSTTKNNINKRKPKMKQRNVRKKTSLKKKHVALQKNLHVKKRVVLPMVKVTKLGKRSRVRHANPKNHNMDQSKVTKPRRISVIRQGHYDVHEHPQSRQHRQIANSIHQKGPGPHTMRKTILNAVTKSNPVVIEERHKYTPKKNNNEQGSNMKLANVKKKKTQVNQKHGTLKKNLHKKKGVVSPMVKVTNLAKRSRVRQTNPINHKVYQSKTIEPRRISVIRQGQYNVHGHPQSRHHKQIVNNIHQEGREKHEKHVIVQESDRNAQGDRKQMVKVNNYKPDKVFDMVRLLKEGGRSKALEKGGNSVSGVSLDRHLKVPRSDKELEYIIIPEEVIVVERQRIPKNVTLQVPQFVSGVYQTNDKSRNIIMKERTQHSAFRTTKPNHNGITELPRLKILGSNKSSKLVNETVLNKEKNPGEEMEYILVEKNMNNAGRAVARRRKKYVNGKTDERLNNRGETTKKRRADKSRLGDRKARHSDRQADEEAVIIRQCDGCNQPSEEEIIVETEGGKNRNQARNVHIDEELRAFTAEQLPSTREDISRHRSSQKLNSKKQQVNFKDNKDSTDRGRVSEKPTVDKNGLGDRHARHSDNQVDEKNVLRRQCDGCNQPSEEQIIVETDEGGKDRARTRKFHNGDELQAFTAEQRIPSHDEGITRRSSSLKSNSKKKTVHFIGNQHRTDRGQLSEKHAVHTNDLGETHASHFDKRVNEEVVSLRQCNGCSHPSEEEMIVETEGDKNSIGANNKHNGEDLQVFAAEQEIPPREDK